MNAPLRRRDLASYDGFNLHTAMAFEGNERTAIERGAATRCGDRWQPALLGPRDTVVYELAKPKPTA